MHNRNTTAGEKVWERLVRHDALGEIEFTRLADPDHRTAEPLEAVVELVDGYRRRWLADFFRIWKSGCRVEALQLGTLERLERALVLYRIIAWRIPAPRDLGPGRPEPAVRGGLRPRGMAGRLDRRPPHQTPGNAAATGPNGAADRRLWWVSWT